MTIAAVAVILLHLGANLPLRTLRRRLRLMPCPAHANNQPCNTMSAPETCYAIASGEYSDYTVHAIFTTKELAEAALPLYKDTENHWWWKIEEYPLNPIIPSPPLGRLAFVVSRQKKNLNGELECARVSFIDLIRSGPAQVQVGPYWLSAYMFARDKDHAIKIASERFAQYDAQQAGIA